MGLTYRGVNYDVGTDYDPGSVSREELLEEQIRGEISVPSQWQATLSPSLRAGRHGFAQVVGSFRQRIDTGVDTNPEGTTRQLLDAAARRCARAMEPG